MGRQLDQQTEWARRFALRIRHCGARLSPEEAVHEGLRMFQLVGPDIPPEDAADAIASTDEPPDTYF